MIYRKPFSIYLRGSIGFKNFSKYYSFMVFLISLYRPLVFPFLRSSHNVVAGPSAPGREGGLQDQRRLAKLAVDPSWFEMNPESPMF